MKNNFSFGVSTWLWVSPFTNAHIDTLFPKIAALGFDTVEIAVEDPALIDPEKVREGLKRYGLKAIICGAFGPGRDFTNESASVHRDCMDYIDYCLNLCAVVGSPFFAGPMYAAVGKARMVPPEQRRREWEMAVTNLRQVAHRAADRGLLLALEPLNRFESDLVNTAADVHRLVRDIDHTAARIMLDLFHSNIEEKDPVAAVQLVGDKLVHLQVSENHRGIPGSGTTAWNLWKKGLDAVGYSGCVSIESFTPDNKELAGAVCIWHPLAESQDAFAIEGLQFLRSWSHQPQAIPQTLQTT